MKTRHYFFVGLVSALVAAPALCIAAVAVGHLGFLGEVNELASLSASDGRTAHIVRVADLGF